MFHLVYLISVGVACDALVRALCVCMFLFDAFMIVYWARMRAFCATDRGRVSYAPQRRPCLQF